MASPNDGGVDIPITSTADTSGFDKTAAAGAALGARLRELQAEEAASAKPVTPTVTVQGAPAAVNALKSVGDAGQAAGKQVGAGMSEADKFIHQLTESAGGLAGAFKAGLGIGAAEAAISAVEGIVDKLKEAVEEGKEVDKEFETLGIGLASSLRQADPDRFADFNAALHASGQLIDVIRQKALELNLDAGALGHNVQVNMLSLVEGGITDLNKQVETTGLLMQAAAAKGITGFQAVRDVIDILNGKAERVILSKELGITNEDIAQAKKAGDLADFLATKLGAYREAAASTRETLAGLEQQESTLGKQLEGTLAAGVFENAKVQAQGMIAAFKSPELQSAAQTFSQILGDVTSIGEASGDVLRIVALLANGAAAVADPLAFMAARINAATAESNRLGSTFADQNKALQTQIQLATDGAAQAKARTDIELAIASAIHARAGASSADKELIDQELTLLRRMLETFDQTAGKVVAIGGHESARLGAMHEQQEALKGQLETIEKIDKEIAKRAAKDDVDGLNVDQIQGRINAALLNARALLAQGGVSVPIDFKASPEELLKLRDNLVPADTTAAAQTRLVALKAQVSTLALSISDLGRAYEGASKESQKEAEQAEKDGQKMIASRRAFNASLDDERAKRGALEQAQAALAAANAAGDSATVDGKRRIAEATKDVEKATNDLAAAQKKANDDQAKAFPQELARLAEIAQALKNMPVTGTSATADARSALQNEARDLQNRVNNKPPQESLDDLDRRSAAAAQTPDVIDKAGDAVAQGAQDTKAAADNLKAGADAFAGAVKDGLAGSADTLGEHVAQIPDSFQPLNLALGDYHKAVGDGFSSLGATVQANTADLQRQINDTNARISNALSDQ